MQSKRLRLGLHFIRLALPLGLLLLGGGIFLTTQSLEAYSRSPFPIVPNARFAPRMALPTEASPLIGQATIPVELTLRRGETVSQVFASLGLEGAEARAATNALAERVDLRTLKAGNRYSAYFNPDSSLASFELVVDGSGRVEMARRDEGWAATWQPFEKKVEVRAVQGVLEGSLEGSIRMAGGPSQLAYRMADIFQWDLDFSRDLRRGDRFRVLYEEVRLDGEYHAVGNVLAAVYENRGAELEAYRYGDSAGYFDGEGRPMRKMFLRSPLRYSRVTSRFSHRRFHPVLKQYRPHYGVDYGAPVGTPVYVTANGVVTFAGWDRGGGNVVKVKHPGGYVTAYLHLSRFAKGIRPGQRVKQGDLVAYSGATGLASGPHLDYRVKHNERWIDPLGLKSVRAEPIPQSELASFHDWRDELRASMEAGVVPADLGIPGRKPEPRFARGRSGGGEPAPAVVLAR
jgi:murein DD-endopeptidase MepM/ murein hydrolase activator NlpD